MAISGHQVGVAATPDDPYAGLGQWAVLSGYAAAAGEGPDPLHGAYELRDAHVTRIVTQPGGGTRGPLGGTGVALLDDWRDVLNWRNSPAPWILLLLLAALGLMQFRVQARAGKARGDIAIG